MLRLKSFFKKNLNFFSVSLIVFLGIWVLAWVFNFFFDNTPPHWDSGRHTFNAMNYFEKFKIVLNPDLRSRPNGFGDSVSQFLTDYYYYPPLNYYASIPFLLFAKTYKVLLLTNVLWFGIFLFSIYKIGKIYKFTIAQISLGLVFVLSMPMILGQFREYQLEIPVLSSVFLNFALISNMFQRRTTGSIFAAAVVFSLSFLIKWTMGIYLAMMFLPFVIKLFLETVTFPSTKKMTSNLWFVVKSAIIFVPCFSIPAFWYAPNMSILLHDLRINSNDAGIAEGDPQKFWPSLEFFAIKVLLNEYFWIPLFLLLLTIIFLFLRNVAKKSFSLKKSATEFNFFVLFFSFVFSFSLLTFGIKQPNKDARYVIPLVLSIFLLISFLAKFLKEKEQKLILLSMVFVGMVNLANITIPGTGFKLSVFAQKNNENGIVYSDSKPKKYEFKILSDSYYTKSVSTNKNWSSTKIIQEISKQKIDLNDPCMIDLYWSKKPTVKFFTDFGYSLNQNFGTYWGLLALNRLYIVDMNYSNEKTCFIIARTNNNYVAPANFEKIYETNQKFEGKNVKTSLYKKTSTEEVKS